MLDFGHYVAGPLSAMLLAEQGADVVHVAPPGGERWVDPGNAYLHRMKRIVTLDLKEAGGRAHAARLIAQADVVIDNFRPGTLQRLGLASNEALASQIRLGLPGFALADPRSAARAWEGIVGAATGLFTDIHLARRLLGLPPVFTALRLASVYAGVHGASSVVAALLRRERTGCGTRIHVPLADAMFHAMGGLVMQVAAQPARYDIPPIPRSLKRLLLPALRAYVRAAGARGRAGAESMAARMVPALMDSYRCADGRLLYVFAMDNVAIARRLTEVTAIRRTLEAEGFVFALAGGPSGAGRDLADPARLSRARQARLRAVLAEALSRHPAHVWEQQLNEAGVPAAVQRSTAEWMNWAPVRASELVVSLDDPDLGPTEMAGRTVIVGDASKASPLGPRAYCTAADVEASWSLPTESERRGGAPIALPLAGSTVVDLSSMVAGPIAARSLAQYGARVWKVEAPVPSHGPRMTRWYGIEVNQGKDPVVLDLKAPDGRAALHALLAQADVLVHNLRPSAAHDCGVDARSLRDFPRLVSASVRAYGGVLPAAFDAWPGYDPVLQASTGIMSRYGSVERPELHAIASCVDYVSGDLLAFGVLSSLLHRSRTAAGTALVVSVSLAQGAQLAQATLLRAASPHAEPAIPHGQHATGWSAGNRLFAARDGHLFAVVPEAAFRTLQIDAAALVPLLRSVTVARAVALLRSAGADAHEASSLHELPVCEVGDALDVDTEALGSLLVRTGEHPAGAGVRTVYPGHVRASPALLRGLLPAKRRGQSQADLAHAAPSDWLDEDYLPG